MIKKRITSAVAAMALVVLFAIPASAQSLTFGKGATSLILFTDFFCPPCQHLEGLIGDSLETIVGQGKASITFCPLPMSKESLVMTAHLFNICSGKAFKVASANRKKLYEMARTRTITNELISEWVEEYNRNKEAVAPYLRNMQKTIEAHKVTSTPTMVVRYADGRKKIFTGYKEINDAIAALSRS